MLTGKILLNTLTDELTEMGLRSMAAALEEMYPHSEFPGTRSAVRHYEAHRA